MTNERTRNDADHCFVCGPKNPIGLKIPFKYAADQCRGEFTPGENHVGFDNVTHGGIIFSVLDDLMANWLFLQRARGYTAKCEIRFREPLPVGTTVDLVCRLKQKKRRLIQLESEAIRQDTGKVVAAAEASFMVDDFGNIEP